MIKDLGMKEPYVGQTALQTGEIAEDLTYYFAVSEQVPSSVGLGVLIDTDCSVRRAGGFIIQLMPQAEEEVIAHLEQKIAKISPVTEMLEHGWTPERMLEELLGSLELVVLDKIPAQFACNCSKERVHKALASIPKKDLCSMADDAEPIEVKCQFCNTAYQFTPDELREMARQQANSEV